MIKAVIFTLAIATPATAQMTNTITGPSGELRGYVHDNGAGTITYMDPTGRVVGRQNYQPRYQPTPPQPSFNDTARDTYNQLRQQQRDAAQGPFGSACPLFMRQYGKC